MKLVRACTGLLLCLLGAILFLPVSLQGTNNCIKEDLIIALDVGHSKLRTGAISARGVPEYEFNQKIAKALYKEMLIKPYVRVFIISQDGEDIPLVTRVDIANKRAANLLLSLHHDSVQPRYLKEWTSDGMKYSYCDKFRGFSIFYSERNGMARNSLLFAKCLGTELLKEGFIPSLHHAERIEGENRELVDANRGIYKYNELMILKYANMAAVLLECGIIVNRGEEEMLMDPVFQKKMVSAILRGIDKYWSEICVER